MKWPYRRRQANAGHYFYHGMMAMTLLAEATSRSKKFLCRR